MSSFLVVSESCWSSDLIYLLFSSCVVLLEPPQAVDREGGFGWEEAEVRTDWPCPSGLMARGSWGTVLLPWLG